MGLAADTKAAIKTVLDGIVTDGDLAEVVETEYNKDFWEQDFKNYPVALLSPPSIPAAELFTNNSNERIYEYEIVVVMKGEDVAKDSTDVEDLMDAIMDKFDNNFDLGGVACGGIQPTTVAPAPITWQDKSFIIFSIFIRAKVIKSLS